MWAAPRQSGFDTWKRLVSRVVGPPKSCMSVEPMIWLPSSTVSRIEPKRSSRTLGAADVDGADVVDEAGVVEVGVDVAVDVAGVDECDEQPASAVTATPTAPIAANRMPPVGIRFDE